MLYHVPCNSRMRLPPTTKYFLVDQRKVLEGMPVHVRARTIAQLDQHLVGHLACNFKNLKDQRKINLSGKGWSGELCVHSASVQHKRNVTGKLMVVFTLYLIFFANHPPTGELPLGLIRLKAKGCDVSLSGNTPGFALPLNLSELDDITKLNLSGCSIHGVLALLF